MWLVEGIIHEALMAVVWNILALPFRICAWAIRAFYDRVILEEVDYGE